MLLNPSQFQNQQSKLVVSDSEPTRITLAGTEIGPALDKREHYDVRYWLDRGGEKALREAESLDGFDKALWHAHDEYIITNGGPVGMTLSESKADNVLDWIGSLSMDEIDEAFDNESS